MKKSLLVLQTVALAALLSACAAKKSREEAYNPSAKLIEVKKDTPIYSTWDRWAEAKSPVFLMGKSTFVEHASLVDLLADDPDPQVIEKIKTYQTWQAAGIATGLVGLVIAGVSWPKKEKRPDGTEYENANWNVLNFGLLMTLVAPAAIYNFSLKYVEEAQGIHNSRINQQVSAMYQWSVK